MDAPATQVAADQESGVLLTAALLPQAPLGGQTGSVIGDVHLAVALKHPGVKVLAYPGQVSDSVCSWTSGKAVHKPSPSVLAASEYSHASIFFLKVYFVILFYAYVQGTWVCAYCMYGGAFRGQERAPIPWRWSYRWLWSTWYECWKLIPDLLQEQRVLSSWPWDIPPATHVFYYPLISGSLVHSSFYSNNPRVAGGAVQCWQQDTPHLQHLQSLCVLHSASHNLSSKIQKTSAPWRILLGSPILISIPIPSRSPTLGPGKNLTCFCIHKHCYLNNA